MGNSVKIAQIGLGLLAGVAATAANAQSVPDDVRCLLLSSAFAKSTDAKVRESATQSMNYYLGRIETRADDQAIISQIRAQSASIDRARAATEMSACATRLMQAQQHAQTLAQSAKAAK